MSQNEITSSHQMFIQSFMSRGLLDAKEVKKLYKDCCDRFNAPFPQNEEEKKNALFVFVRTINNNIKKFHMEIKKGISEDDGSNFYGLVNITQSHITRMASDFTQNELELFKKMVEAIVSTEDGCVGSTEVLNMTEGLQKKMGKDSAESFLERMEKNMWIKMVDGQISLATRALLELEQYILDMYPEAAVRCNMCNKLSLKGQVCISCGTKLHLHCAQRLFQGQDTPKCPNSDCGASWVHDVPGRPDSDLTQSGQPSSSMQTRKRKQPS